MISTNLGQLEVLRSRIAYPRIVKTMTYTYTQAMKIQLNIHQQITRRFCQQVHIHDLSILISWDFFTVFDQWW